MYGKDELCLQRHWTKDYEILFLTKILLFSFIFDNQKKKVEKQY